MAAVGAVESISISGVGAAHDHGRVSRRSGTRHQIDAHRHRVRSARDDGYAYTHANVNRDLDAACHWHGTRHGDSYRYADGNGDTAVVIRHTVYPDAECDGDDHRHTDDDTQCYTSANGYADSASTNRDQRFARFTDGHSTRARYRNFNAGRDSDRTGVSDERIGVAFDAARAASRPDGEAALRFAG